jgi:hypothetical protein
MWTNRCCCRHQDDSSGVGWIIFSMFMFTGAAICFSVAYISAHLWFFSMLCLRLLEGKWIRATWWLALLIGLLWLDGWMLLNLDLS